MMISVKGISTSSPHQEPSARGVPKSIMKEIAVVTARAFGYLLGSD